MEQTEWLHSALPTVRKHCGYCAQNLNNEDEDNGSDDNNDK